MDTINERLGRLERSVRRWRWMTLACLLLAGTIFVIAADTAPKDGVIRGKRIVLDDDDNGYRVQIGSTSKGATAFQVWKGDAMQFSAGASPKGGMTIMGVDSDNRIRFVYPPNSLDKP
jgi:hypothetical protein